MIDLDRVPTLVEQAKNEITKALIRVEAGLAKRLNACQLLVVMMLKDQGIEIEETSR